MKKIKMVISGTVNTDSDQKPATPQTAFMTNVMNDNKNGETEFSKGN